MLRDCNARCNISGDICEGKPLRFNAALKDEMKNYSIAQRGFDKVSMPPQKTLDAISQNSPVLVNSLKVDIRVGDLVCRKGNEGFSSSFKMPYEVFS